MQLIKSAHDTILGKGERASIIEDQKKYLVVEKYADFF